ncbi:thymidylate synthase [Aeromonas veronii]|uniref:thymidylate synthase n=1 Tax=Aeromonas veronii TaxID=654 RepID=UPI001E4866F4|nr:thymidylate synthase [Aeromonas veronii]MCD6618813.1 thymidylate synthase [Aeromonas veronii]
MLQYLELGSQILGSGQLRDNRTDVRSIAMFGSRMRFDLSDNKLALITTKKLHLKSVIHELIWMLSGDTNIRYLNDNGVTIWDEWADENGELGPVYGAQWRAWRVIEETPNGLAVRVIDQIANLIDTLRNNPHDRRMIVTAWNVGRLHEMRLAPCHMMFQCFSDLDQETGERLLSMQVYQRSVDYFLGLPFNLIFYSILAHMLAEQTGHKAHELIHIGGDVHIYENHIDQVKLQLSRDPKDAEARLVLTPRSSIDEYTFADVNVTGYDAHPHIKGAVAV